MNEVKGKNKRNAIKSLIIDNSVVVIVFLLVIIMSVLSDRFLTSVNLFNVLRQICVTGIVASGFTMIICAQEIDLSVGSVVGFVGIVMASLMVKYQVPIWITLIVGVIVGALCCMLNAVIISAFNLPPFIVTYATQSLFRGIIYISTNMVPISNLPEDFIFIGQGYVGAVPIPVIIMVVMFAVMWFITKRTTFGRYVVAMGSNKDAAFLCGISISKVRLGVYALVGACSAIAAMVLTGRTASAQVSAGMNLEFDCITAVVVGGTAFTGGNMNVIGTILGCLVVGIINNGLNLLGVNSNYQIIAKGMMILLALLLDNWTTSLVKSKR